MKRIGTVPAVIEVMAMLFICGCSQVCRTVVEDVVTIQNKTGRRVLISVCRVAGKPTDPQYYGGQRVEISSNFSGQLVLGRSKRFRRSDFDGKCQNEVRQIPVNVALSQRTLRAIRRCYDTQDASLIVLVKHWESCPAGTREQAEGPSNCEPDFRDSVAGPETESSL